MSLVNFVLESFRNNINPFVKVETLVQSTEFYTIDVRKGGLIIGRSHDDGGIWFAITSDTGVDVIFQELEGYEYIINGQSTASNITIIESINKYKELEFQAYTPPNNVTVIDVREFEQSNKQVLLILTNDQFIVNKYATKKHLAELEELNAKLR